MNGFRKVSDSFIAALVAQCPTFEGVGIAVPTSGNKFILVHDGRAGGDFPRVSIDDRKGEFFYIRLKGDIEESKVIGRGSCSNDNRITAKCKLVMQSECLDPMQLVEHFLPGLRAFKSKTITPSLTGATASPKSYNLDFAAIAKSEVADEEKDGTTGWDGAHYLASIDFELTYIVDCSQNCDC